MSLYFKKHQVKRYASVKRRQIHRSPKLLSFGISIRTRRSPEPQRWKLPVRATGYLKRRYTYTPCFMGEDPPAPLIWQLKGLV